MKKTQLVQKVLLLSAFSLLSSLGFSQVSQQWVARYNGSLNGSDRATAMAVDAAGNVYVTGSSQVGEANSDYATIKYDANGNQLWVSTYNGTGNGGDGASAIAIDADGNVYVTGQSEGSGFFNYDYVTIKHDANGNQLWVSRYDGPGTATDIASAIAVDAAGNVYVTGSSYGSASNTDYATIKYNNVGIVQWVSRYNGPGNGHDGAYALALGDDGNIYVTGYSTGSGTEEDYATIKYNTNNGEQEWVARYNGPANSLDQAFSLALDHWGNVYVTGQSFEPETGSAYATVKYNASGAQQWVARYHAGVGSDLARAIAVDASGNAYVTGNISDDKSDYGKDYTTIKYDTYGVQQWVAGYDGPDHDNDVATALAVDAAGNVYVTGYSSGDYTTIKYNTNGVQQWLARYGGPGNATDIPSAMALDAADNVYVTGFSYVEGPDADYATIKYVQFTDCGNKDNKVVVCHKGKTLCIDAGAVASHLNHGDQPGACPSPVVTTAKTKTNVAGQHLEGAGSFSIFHSPNPVSTVAKIKSGLPFDGNTSIKVYDMLGRQVATVGDAGRKAGYYTTDFDASALPNGMYYYRIILKTEKKVLMQTQKMTVVK